MNRQQTLKALAKKQEERMIPVVADGKPFIDALEKKFLEFGKKFDDGLDINGIETLVNDLEQIGALAEPVTELKKAIEAIKFPEHQKSIEIKDLSVFMKALKDSRAEFIQSESKSLLIVEDALNRVTEAIDGIAIPEQTQNIEEYTPVRRVVQVGRKLMWDDSIGGGGGSGGGIDRGLTRNEGTTIAVTNPDGTDIGSSGGSGLTDAELRASPVDVNVSGGVTLDPGDIEIGAVEIKDSTSDNRTSVINSAPTTEYGLVTRNIPSGTQTIAGTVAVTGAGDATAANQVTTNTEIGGLTETAPASDTASSGLNGRLQRIAQRLTSLIALLPGSLGQKARAASLAVTLSTEDVTALTPPAAITGFATSANQTTEIASLSSIDTKLTSPLTTGKKMATTSTQINVSTSTSVATLYALNTSRVEATIWNNSTTGILYVKKGAAATSTSHDFQLAPATSTFPGGNCIIDNYSGIITGILSTGTGTATGGEAV